MMFLGFYEMHKAWQGLPGCRSRLSSVHNDPQMALAIFMIVEADSQKGPAFTNGFGFSCNQFVIQSINPE